MRFIIALLISLLASSPAFALTQSYVFTTTSSSPPLTAIDTFVELNATGGAFTHTLPDATKSYGLRTTCIKTDSSGNAITISTVSSQNILTTSGNATTASLAAQGNSITLISDGTQWFKVSGT